MNGDGTPDKPFDTRAADYQVQLSQGLRLAGESKEFFARGRLQHLRAFWRETGRAEPTSVIDYGCGTGDVTVLLAEFFPHARILGVDPSRSFVDQAQRELGSARVSFAPLEGFAPLLAAPADLVHLNGVVHHVPHAERGAFFDALKRCLSPGGLVSLFDNNPWNPGTHLVMRRIPFDRGVRPVRAGEVAARLRATGLRILRTSFLFYFPASLRSLRPLEAALERLPLGAQYGLYAERPPEGTAGPPSL